MNHTGVPRADKPLEQPEDVRMNSVEGTQLQNKRLVYTIKSLSDIIRRGIERNALRLRVFDQCAIDRELVEPSEYGRG